MSAGQGPRPCGARLWRATLTPMTIPTLFLIATATAVAAASAVAPASAASFAGYGFRSGVALSRFQGAGESGTRAGFAGSAFARISLGGVLSIQPEIGWVSKGDEGSVSIRYTNPGPGPITTETVDYAFQTHLDYLEVPLLLRLDLPAAASLTPHVLMGAAVAFRIGSGRTSDVTLPLPQPSSPQVRRSLIYEEAGTFNDPNFRDVDWSMIAGGRLAIGRGALQIVIDGRYALGLVGVYPNLDRSKAHNGSWITTVGIELR